MTESEMVVECYVCHENITGESSASAMSCGHVCCEQCLLRWFARAKCCPVCRYDESDVDENGNDIFFRPVFLRFSEGHDNESGGSPGSVSEALCLHVSQMLKALAEEVDNDTVSLLKGKKRASNASESNDIEAIARQLTDKHRRFAAIVKKKATDLQASVTEERRKATGLDRDLASATATLEQAKERISQLIAENRHAKEELVSAQRGLKERASREDQQVQEIERLREVEATLKGTIRKLKKERERDEGLRDEMQSLQSRKADQDDEVQQLKRENDQLRRRLANAASSSSCVSASKGQPTRILSLTSGNVNRHTIAQRSPPDDMEWDIEAMEKPPKLDRSMSLDAKRVAAIWPAPAPKPKPKRKLGSDDVIEVIDPKKLSSLATGPKRSRKLP